MPIIKCPKCGEKNEISLSDYIEVWFCERCGASLNINNALEEEYEDWEDSLKCRICERVFTSKRSYHLLCYKCWSSIKNLIGEFIQAIEEEISSVRNKESKILVIDGKLIREEGRMCVYSFQFGKEDKIYAELDDVRAEIKIDNSRYAGGIIGVKDSEIIIYIDDNLGKSIPKAELIIDRCFLYEKLKEKFEGILESNNEISREDLLLVNSIFIRKGKNLQSEVATSFPLLSNFQKEFNNSQQKAIKVSQQLPMTLIWGPPGTGKTKTLAGVVAEFLMQGKKILVTAHSNVAVDEATIKIADFLKETNYYKDGEIIRIGNYQKEELKIKYPLVLITEIVKSQKGELFAKWNILEKKKKTIEEILSQLVKLLNLLEKKASNSQNSREEKQEDEGQILIFQKKLKLYSQNTGYSIKFSSKSAISETIKRLDGEKEKILSQIEVLKEELEAIVKSLFLKSKVICTTLTKTFSDNSVLNLISEKNFDVLIVDEASMAPIPYIYWALRQCRENVIIVGDFLQLQPICSNEYKEGMAKKWLKRSIYNHLELDTVPKVMEEGKVCLLEIQYRMNPKISKISNEIFYHNSLKDAEETKTFNLDFGEFNGTLILIDTSSSSLSRCEKVPGSSRINKFHAEAVINLLKKILIFEGFKNRKIGIITPYNPQVKFIKERIKEEKLKLKNLSVTTVHRFQGGEAEIIIFDTVEAPGLKTSRSMLEDDRKELLNVAITRAKCKIFLVANLDFIKKELSHCTFLTRIIDILKHDGEVKEV